jgi:SAM-dependent methyltransferase
MRLLLIVLAACHAPAPASPSDSDIVARSHAYLDALDRGDVDAVKATLGSRYVRFEGSYIDRDRELADLAQSRTDPSSHTASRTWSDERVFARSNDAIFIGRAKDRQAGNASHGGGYVFDGWYTLGWSRESGRWQLVYASWRVAGDMSDAAMWNQIFRNATGFEHAPNKLLVTAAALHPAGTAVDVTMGQGRNALYLASQGWSVTGVDLSDEGVKQARDAAAAKHLALDAVVADVTTFDYGAERYDLVAMIYAFPAIARIPDLQRATRHGGLFVYEYFAPDGSPDDVAPKPGALANQFAGWEILRDEIVDDVPDWRTDRAKIQRFVARKP